MKRHGPVKIIIHHPETEDGKLELAKRVSEVHADAVNARIKDLRCPTVQKLQLLDAVINTAKQKVK